ncbi:hypothetical protein KI387_017790, partial [Taxus chinensis]
AFRAVSSSGRVTRCLLRWTRYLLSPLLHTVTYCLRFSVPCTVNNQLQMVLVHECAYILCEFRVKGGFSVRCSRCSYRPQQYTVNNRTLQLRLVVVCEWAYSLCEFCVKGGYTVPCS